MIALLVVCYLVGVVWLVERCIVDCDAADMADPEFHAEMKRKFGKPLNRNNDR